MVDEYTHWMVSRWNEELMHHGNMKGLASIGFYCDFINVMNWMLYNNKQDFTHLRFKTLKSSKISHECT